MHSKTGFIEVKLTTQENHEIRRMQNYLFTVTNGFSIAIIHLHTVKLHEKSLLSLV